MNIRYAAGMPTPPLKTIAKTLRKNQTRPEEKFWQEVKAKRLGGYKFRRQVAINNFVADFVCEQKKLVVELDGAHHKDQSKKDSSRTAELERYGYRVVRIWNGEVIENMEGVLEWLLQELES